MRSIHELYRSSSPVPINSFYIFLSTLEFLGLLGSRRAEAPRERSFFTYFLPNESIKFVCSANLYSLEKLFTCLSKPNAGGLANACNNPTLMRKLSCLSSVPSLLSSQVGYGVLVHYDGNGAEPHTY